MVVVGGGIAGASAAFHLAAHGRRVALLERGEIASAASGLNMGGVDSYGWGESPDLQAHLTAGSIELFTTVQNDLGEDIEFRRSGGLGAGEGRGLSLLQVAARAAFECSLCGAPAGEIVLYGTPTRGELRRNSPVTGDMTRWPAGEEFERLRDRLATGRPGAVFAADLELLPAYCPECDRVYCQAHWSVWQVRDEDVDYFWLVSFRGRCPEGHERMLED